jgi:hypothetical protein
MGALASLIGTFDEFRVELVREADDRRNIVGRIGVVSISRSEASMHAAVTEGSM